LPGKKRERELQRQRYQRRRARAQREHERRRRINTIVGAVVAVLVVAGGASYAGVALSGGGGGKTAAKTSPSASPTARSTASPSSSAQAFDGTCSYTPTKGAPHVKDVGTPPAKVAHPTRRTATIKTNRGTITATLLGKKAPCTVNSLAFLASKDYFNDTPCHRLTTKGIFVLQCGDPSGTGSGGPGYKFNDENLAAFGGKPGGDTPVTYPAGTLAMANSGPGTNGSQFFLVYSDSKLAPKYTPFGRITSGLDVVKQVAKKGVQGGGSDGKPAKKVTIEDLTVSKAKAAPSKTSASPTPSAS
jgi:peptidyl-prolyl cis-trans isomerase B (cyclophilin B)